MHKHLLLLTLVLAGLSLATVTGCGNDTPPLVTVPPEPLPPAPPPPPPPPPAPLATSLEYTDPASDSGWRLVKDPSSTTTRLVLNLVGPAGVKTRGVGFNLQGVSGVKFGVFANGLPLQDTGVYQLSSVANLANEPVALMGGLKKGNLLTVGIYQKDRARTAKDSDVALVQVALELDAAAQLRVGQTLTVSAPKAAFIPEDIGSAADDLWTLEKKLKMKPIQIAVGPITAG
jgi:hypothetical protein